MTEEALGFVSNKAPLILMSYMRVC